MSGDMELISHMAKEDEGSRRNVCLSWWSFIGMQEVDKTSCLGSEHDKNRRFAWRDVAEWVVG